MLGSTRQLGTRLQTSLLLIVILAIAFGLRTWQLDHYGFNEDEVQKIDAINAYRAGNFDVNLEHPMLLKLAGYASLQIGHTINQAPPARARIASESALRFPNALAGTSTALVLFLLCRRLFTSSVAYMASLFWAIHPICVAINRIAKEDTLLTLFCWSGLALYWSAKTRADQHAARTLWMYAGSGAAFGLMLASKYLPHYLGLNFLFFFLYSRLQPFPPLDRRIALTLYGPLLGAFLTCNWVVLRPATLLAMARYPTGHTVTHHGYLALGTLHFEDFAHAGSGMPVHLYLLLLLTKTPLLMLAAFLFGLWTAARNWRRPGYALVLFHFLFWIVPFSLLPAKWLRYMGAVMPAVVILMAIGLVQAIRLSVPHLVRQPHVQHRLRALALASALALIAGEITFTTHDGLIGPDYHNALPVASRAWIFPHDEANDAQVREAAAYLATQAPPHACIATEVHPLMRYYLQQHGRDDLRLLELRSRDVPPHCNSGSFAVLGYGREYQENLATLSSIRNAQTPIQVFWEGEIPAVEVYRTAEQLPADFSLRRQSSQTAARVQAALHLVQ